MEGWEERFDATAASLGAQITQLRDEMRVEFFAVHDEIRTIDEAVRTDLTEAIRGGDEETRRFMRVLHEDLVERIARLGEAR